MRIVGKISRIISKDEKICTFENYGLGLIPTNKLINIFSTISENADTSADFNDSDIEVEGPAIQILPMMVFL